MHSSELLQPRDDDGDAIVAVVVRSRAEAVAKRNGNAKTQGAAVDGSGAPRAGPARGGRVVRA